MRSGSQAVVKTSGSKGLQVYVPLNRPAEYADTKGFARSLARLLEKEHPDLVVSRMKRELRAGKVYVDWQQNEDFKTTVCAYSLRAREQPTVSTPLRWEEVEAAADDGDEAALVFDAPAAARASRAPRRPVRRRARARAGAADRPTSGAYRAAAARIPKKRSSTPRPARSTSARPVADRDAGR